MTDAEIEMFYDLDDCEHGIPGWDQCDACIAKMADEYATEYEPPPGGWFEYLKGGRA